MKRRSTVLRQAWPTLTTTSALSRLKLRITSYRNCKRKILKLKVDLNSSRICMKPSEATATSTAKIYWKPKRKSMTWKWNSREWRPKLTNWKKRFNKRMLLNRRRTLTRQRINLKTPSWRKRKPLMTRTLCLLKRWSRLKKTISLV